MPGSNMTVAAVGRSAIKPAKTHTATVYPIQILLVGLELDTQTI